MPGPLGDSWERRRAKHQALGATQVLDLRNGKRDAGREKVEAQAKHNIHVLCQERLWGAISRSWRSASGISASSGCARSRGIWKTKSVRHPRQCKSASIVSAESLDSGRLLGAPSTGSLICITRRNCGICKWSRMFAGTQFRRHASRSRGPQVRRVMYHRVKVSEGVYAAAIWPQGNNTLGCSERRILASSERCRAATGIRRQAATGCETKRKTVRSLSVSARPLH